MDEEPAERYCREVLGVFTFGARRLLTWDSFRCHLTPAVKNLLNKGKIDSAIVPGGCTKYIQAHNVSWNKHMKEYLREMYDLWLADGTHELTAHGNMRAPPRWQMIKWVLEAWKMLPTDVIARSFKVCALSTNVDGSEDDQIVCIKHGPCQNLLEKLKAWRRRIWPFWYWSFRRRYVRRGHFWPSHWRWWWRWRISWYRRLIIFCLTRTDSFYLFFVLPVFFVSTQVSY